MELSSNNNKQRRRPFELIDMSSDLEVGTIGRLDYDPDVFGVDKFLRSNRRRTQGTKDIT